jgi:hypothetical protein
MGTLVAALSLQAVGLWLSLHRYWAGGGLEPVRAMARFAPIPGGATAAVLVLLGLSGAAALAMMVVPERTQEP